MTTAYCAPGRESITAILLAFQDIEFDEVRASVIMAGREDVILVDNEKIAETFAQTGDAMRELGLTAEKTSQAVLSFFRNYVSAPVLTDSSLRMLSTS